MVFGTSAGGSQVLASFDADAATAWFGDTDAEIMKPIVTEIWPDVTSTAMSAIEEHFVAALSRFAQRRLVPCYESVERGVAREHRPLESGNRLGDRAGHRHDLVDRRSALVARVAAGVAAHRVPAAVIVLALAHRAQPAHQALGQHAQQRRAQQKGFNPHVDQPVDPLLVDEIEVRLAHARAHAGEELVFEAVLQPLHRLRQNAVAAAPLHPAECIP